MEGQDPATVVSLGTIAVSLLGLLTFVVKAVLTEARETREVIRAATVTITRLNDVVEATGEDAEKARDDVGELRLDLSRRPCPFVQAQPGLLPAIRTPAQGQPA